MAFMIKNWHILAKKKTKKMILWISDGWRDLIQYKQKEDRTLYQTNKSKSLPKENQIKIRIVAMRMVVGLIPMPIEMILLIIVNQLK